MALQTSPENVMLAGDTLIAGAAEQIVVANRKRAIIKYKRICPEWKKCFKAEFVGFNLHSKPTNTLSFAKIV